MEEGKIESTQEKDEKTSQVEALKAQIEDLTNKWKRAAADYQNLEKRATKDREDWFKLSNFLLLSKLVPVLDDLERASFHLDDDGLRMIVKNLRIVLSEEGVQEIKVKSGDNFDPHLQECVEIVEGDEDQKVIEVVAKGYIIGERVIRPAKVKVSKKKVEPLPPEAEKEVGGGDYV